MVNNNLFSINKSVFGVEYQYKYILLRVLEYLLAGRLEYAFVNFPINKSSQCSLDGKFVLMEPREILIYEIKTGDNFKNDRKNELKHVLNVFYTYEQDNNEKKCKKIIVVDYKTKARIENHILDFMHIKENRRNNNSGESITEIKNRVCRDFNFDNSNISQNEFIKFIKEVDFEEGPSYKRNSENDILTDIEDKIKCVIDDFCYKLEIRSTDIEIPSFSIALELVEIIRQCSQNTKNIVEDICKKLTECLSRRRLIQEAIYEKDKEILFKCNIKPKIKKRITEITKIQIKERVLSLWENKDNTTIQE